MDLEYVLMFNVILYGGEGCSKSLSVFNSVDCWVNFFK